MPFLDISFGVVLPGHKFSFAAEAAAARRPCAHPVLDGRLPCGASGCVSACSRWDTKIQKDIEARAREDNVGLRWVLLS